MKHSSSIGVAVALSLAAVAAWAGIPEPDAVLYGHVFIDRVAQQASDEVTVYARVDLPPLGNLPGPEDAAVGSYRLGDSLAASGAISDGDAYTGSTSVELTLSASDGGSDVAMMRFSNDGFTWSPWEAYARSKTWTLLAGDGEKTVHVQYNDLAGNPSDPSSDTIILDTTAPTGTITINDGDASTGSASVNLRHSSSWIISNGLGRRGRRVRDDQPRSR